MTGEFDVQREVYLPGAFDGQVPKRVPVRGPDGEIIPGAYADVDLAEDGSGDLIAKVQF